MQCPQKSPFRTEPYTFNHFYSPTQCRWCLCVCHVNVLCPKRPCRSSCTSAACSPAVLVFLYLYEPDSSRGYPTLRASSASNRRGVGKSRKIRPINRSHSSEGSTSACISVAGLLAIPELICRVQVRDKHCLDGDLTLLVW